MAKNDVWMAIWKEGYTVGELLNQDAKELVLCKVIDDDGELMPFDRLVLIKDNLIGYGPLRETEAAEYRETVKAESAEE